MQPGRERLVADRLSEEDAVALGRLVKRKRDIASDEHAEPLTDDEKREWETLLGRAAGDEQLFERKRRDAPANAKLNALRDKRKVASLPRHRFSRAALFRCPVRRLQWLLGDGWTLMDIGLSVAVLACFQNDDPQLFPNGHFEGEGDHRTLVVPGGIGADLRMRGKIAGSPLEDNGSGHVRVREALRVLVANRWFTVEQTVAETRIRLGKRARKLGESLRVTAPAASRPRRISERGDPGRSNRRWLGQPRR